MILHKQLNWRDKLDFISIVDNIWYIHFTEECNKVTRYMLASPSLDYLSDQTLGTPCKFFHITGLKEFLVDQTTAHS